MSYWFSCITGISEKLAIELAEAGVVDMEFEKFLTVPMETDGDGSAANTTASLVYHTSRNVGLPA